MKSNENEQHNTKVLDKKSHPFTKTEVPLKRFNELKLSIHHFTPSLYLHTMHHWASAPYSSRFWQMNIPFQEFKDHYERLTKSGKYSVFVVSANNIPISQTEVYQVQNDPLSEHVEAKDSDYGIHLLMAPYRDLLTFFGQQTRGLAAEALVTVLDMLFGTLGATSVYAEPDIQNKHACNLAEQVGFTFLKKITLAEKEAKLYKITKKAFQSLYHPSK